MGMHKFEGPDPADKDCAWRGLAESVLFDIENDRDVPPDKAAAIKELFRKFHECEEYMYARAASALRVGNLDTTRQICRLMGVPDSETDQLINDWRNPWRAGSRRA